MLSQREAWAYLAGLWNNPLIDYWKRPYIDKWSFPSYGLCSCLDEMFNHNMITKRTHSKMLLTINSKHSYLWPLTQDGAEARVQFCLKQCGV